MFKNKFQRKISIIDQYKFFISFKRGKLNIKYLLAAYCPKIYFKRVIKGTIYS